MFRAPLGRLGAERFTVARHQHRDLTGRLRTMKQGTVHFRLSLRKVRKILHMGGLFFHLLPPLFHRIAIGGGRRQLLHRQARCMRLEKVLHGLARMSARAILHHIFPPHFGERRILSESY